MRWLSALWKWFKRIDADATAFMDPNRIFTAPSWSTIIWAVLFTFSWWVVLFFHQEIVIWYELTFNGKVLQNWGIGKYLLFRIIVSALALLGLSACIAAGIRYHKQLKQKKTQQGANK